MSAQIRMCDVARNISNKKESAKVRLSKNQKRLNSNLRERG